MLGIHTCSLVLPGLPRDSLLGLGTHLCFVMLARSSHICSLFGMEFLYFSPRTKLCVAIFARNSYMFSLFWQRIHTCFVNLEEFTQLSLCGPAIYICVCCCWDLAYLFAIFTRNSHMFPLLWLGIYICVAIWAGSSHMFRYFSWESKYV